MAGALGKIPTEGDLISSFHRKGTEVDVETARQIIKAVQAHWKEKKGEKSEKKDEKPEKKGEKSPKGSELAERVNRLESQVQQMTQKPEPKPEVAATPRSYPSPPPKRTDSYGRRCGRIS